MKYKYNKRLNLIDGMIVIAALAAWLALIRVTLPVRDVPPKVVVILNVIVMIVDSLTALSFACLAIRLRQPRPRLRRLARQPGFAACVVIAVAMTIIGVVGYVLALFRIGWIRPDVLALIAMHGVGFAVSGSWLTLLLTGRWRPTSDWFDRIGRAAGIVAIMCLLMPWVLQILI